MEGQKVPVPLCPKAVLPFRPSQLVVVDLNENGLAELTRDLRSTDGMFVPDDCHVHFDS